MKNAKKRMMTCLIAGAACMAMLAGCQSAGKPAAEPASSSAQTAQPTKKPDPLTKLNITYVKSPLNVPSILQKNKQLFDKEFSGTTIGWPELTSGPQQTQALASGDLQILNAVGAPSALLAASNGVDLKIISMYSRAPKAFMIVSNQESIRSVKDLKGKKVAGPKGTVLHQLLTSALVKEGMGIQDVQFVSMELPDALAALTGKSVDAALLAGPVAQNALKSGAHTITTGEGLVDATIVVAASGDFIAKHPDAVDKFLKVQKESLAFMKEKPDETAEIVAKELGITADEVKRMLPLYNFDMTITDNDLAELKKTQEFQLENKLQQKAVDIQALIYKR